VALLLMLIWKRVSLNKMKQSNEQTRQQDYIRTGLELPASWDPQSVLTLISTLSARLQRAVMFSELQLRHRESQEKLSAVRRETQPMLDRLQSTAVNAGSLLRNSPRPSSYAELYHTLKLFVELISTDSALAGLRGKLLAAEKSRDEARRMFVEGLSILDPGAEAPSTPELAAAIVSTQRTRYQEWINLRTTLEGEVQQADAARQQLTDAVNAKTRVAERLKLEETDLLAAVKLLSQDLPAYRTAVEERKEAEIRQQEALRRLKSHTQFSEDLLDMPPDEIHTRLSACKSQADTIEGLKKSITETETLVGKAGESTVLQQSLTAKDEALDALLKVYHANLDALAGDVLATELKQVVGTDHVPEVLKRASILFTNITRGRYRLHLTHSPEAAFHAFDVHESEGKTLDQLSSGTRIQLLIAVRVAWIQTQERNVMLPLFADELLANSDDERASAIVQAIAEISREGRQVFYFTAQTDELAKWKGFLQDYDVPYTVVYLGTDTARTTTPSFTVPLPRLNPVPEIPEPAGLSYEKYLEKIEIKPVNILSHNEKDFHSGLLLDSADVLYNCLQLGLNRCGMVHNFISQGLARDVMSIEQQQAFEKRFKAAGELVRLSRVGQILPVTRREVLEDSQAVSAVFIDRVYTCLMESDYNPNVLLDALSSGAVSGFRGRNREMLEEYLKQEGYLPATEPLASDELQARFRLYLRQLPLDPSDFPLERLRKYTQPPT
jgi:ABC-type enterochelin transport system ATPase subunit